MASVNSPAVLTSLSTLNALAGKISPQTSTTCSSNSNNRRESNGSEQEARGDAPTTNGGRTDLDGDATMNNGVLNTVRQPDHDAIKMFVGQVPRCMDEADLRKMFEEFGEVYQINVLRDKVTGTSKGCCFVTFYTRKAALDAQNLLHNIKTLPGMHHPIQMKPADTENRLDRKLFLGMLNKSQSEQDVRGMFCQFGVIEDCSVLRDSNGHSKGCAFVTFSQRTSAIAAIKKMHHSYTMEGCTMPLVVKFADTPKEKDQKKMQQHSQNLWNAASTNTLAALGPHYLSLLQNISHSPPSSVSGGGSGGLGSYGSSQHLGGLGGGSGNLGGGSSMSQLGGLSNVSTMSTMQQLLAASQGGMTSQHQMFDTSLTMNMQNLAALAAIAAGSGSGLQALTQPGFASSLSNHGLGGSTGNLGSAGHINALSSSNPAGKQVEGPPGANLFIYHLPQDFGDADLAQCFWSYGKVISAKVFIDKQTNLSKCFGFVSYENSHEAQTAITEMNGRQIGNKRLKVQLKRPKDGRPY